MRVQRDFDRILAATHDGFGAGVFTVEFQYRAGILQDAQMHVQQRVHPRQPDPVRGLPGQDRIAAGDRIGDADDIVQADVIEHDQRGHHAVGHVAFEAAFPARQRDPFRIQPVLPLTVAPEFDTVDDQLLVGGIEVDLEASCVTQRGLRLGLEGVVDVVLVSAGAAIDLFVEQPVPPAHFAGSRRLRIPRLGDVARPHIGRRRPDGKNKIPTAILAFGCLRPPGDSQQPPQHGLHVTSCDVPWLRRLLQTRAGSAGFGL